MYVTFEDIRTFEVVGRPASDASDDAAAAESFGTLHDLYVDTRDWRVAWLVLERGGLILPDRVLLGTDRRVAFDTGARRIVTDLRDYDVERAPGEREVRTVSEQRDDERVSRGGSGVMPLGPAGEGPPVAGGAGAALAPDAGALPPSEEERHLRSARELVGYAVAGRDGEVGTVRDLLVDTESPAIAWLSIDVGGWLANREVVVRPTWTTGVSWADRRVALDLTRTQIEEAPPLASLDGLDRAYASSLARFYRLPPL